MSRRSRSLNLLEPQESHQACSGKPLPFYVYINIHKYIHTYITHLYMRTRTHAHAHTHTLALCAECNFYISLIWESLEVYYVGKIQGSVMEKEHVHLSVTVLGRTNKTESNPCRLGYDVCVTEYFTSDSGGHWATNPEALEKSSSETFLQTKGFSHKAPLMWCLVPAVQPWRKRLCGQMEWCTRWFKYDRDKLWLFTHKSSRSYLNHLVYIWRVCTVLS
jgi:hypothetical protein